MRERVLYPYTEADREAVLQKLLADGYLLAEDLIDSQGRRYLIGTIDLRAEWSAASTTAAKLDLLARVAGLK